MLMRRTTEKRASDLKIRIYLCKTVVVVRSDPGHNQVESDDLTQPEAAFRLYAAKNGTHNNDRTLHPYYAHKNGVVLIVFVKNSFHTPKINRNKHMKQNGNMKLFGTLLKTDLILCFFVQTVRSVTNVYQECICSHFATA